MIKCWPQFDDRCMPYSGTFSISTGKLKFVPLGTPCPIHADGFDCYHMDCSCAEFKFVRRSEEEMAEIKRMQEQIRQESILRQADEIRKTLAA